MPVKALSLCAIAALALAVPAYAHHSFAMFDAGKTVTLTGTVKEFEWTNPHAWLRVMIRLPESRCNGRSKWARPGSRPSAAGDRTA